MLDKNPDMIFPRLMQKFLPLWVALSISLAIFIGYHFPGIKVLKTAIPFLLFVMLYPMMINLRVEDIGKALKDWKLFSIAVLMNFLLTPVLGALWAHILFSQADPYLFGLTIFFCKIFHIGHGHSMALGYSVAAKNHAITIGVATTAFGGTLAVLPAAVAPIIQIPTMLLYLKFSDGIRKYLEGATTCRRSSHL